MPKSSSSPVPPKPPTAESEAVAEPGQSDVETDVLRGGSGDAEKAAELLGSLRREMNRLQREIRIAIQSQLAQMRGLSLGSIEANRELANSIHEMLDAHGLRVRCTQCGHPAILRVSPRAGAPAGVFVFDHTIDGRRTFHGGRGTLPELHLVAKPRRKQRSNGS